MTIADGPQASEQSPSDASTQPDRDGSSGKPPVETPEAAPVLSAPAVQEIISKLPQPERQMLERSFSMLVSGPAVNPMLAKLDAQHLHKILDGAENESKREHEDRSRNRSHARFMAVVGLVGFIAISGLFLWLHQGDLLKGVLTGFALFLGGLGFGSRFLRRTGDDS